jgi:hypothetical protein
MRFFCMERIQRPQFLRWERIVGSQSDVVSGAALPELFRELSVHVPDGKKKFNETIEDNLYDASYGGVSRIFAVP